MYFYKSVTLTVYKWNNLVPFVQSELREDLGMSKFENHWSSHTLCVSCVRACMRAFMNVQYTFENSASYAF